MLKVYLHGQVSSLSIIIIFIMKVLLLGGTGRTGKLILKQLSDRGHYVNAIVRSKLKVNVPSGSLQVMEGSVLDERLLEAALAGCDAIVSALNISRNSDFPWSALRTPKTLMSGTISKIIPLAHKHQVKRIIVLSAWGANDTRKDIPWWFRWIIENSNINYGYQDHERQEQLLQNSDLKYTIIRPAGLINSNRDNPIKVSLNNKPRPSLLISRKAVAVFTVDAFETAGFIRLSPAISW